LPLVYWQNGYVDIIRPEVILEMGMMCGRTILPFIIDEPVLEIDYQDHIPQVEEALLKLQEGQWPSEEEKTKRHSV
jgi:hypothetical protein